MPLCSSLGPPGLAESCRPRASRPTRAAGTRWRHTRAPGTTCWARAGCGCAAWSSSGASISPLGPPGPAESGPPRGARSARAPGTRRTRGRRTGATNACGIGHARIGYNAGYDIPQWIQRARRGVGATTAGHDRDGQSLGRAGHAGVDFVSLQGRTSGYLMTRHRATASVPPRVRPSVVKIQAAICRLRRRPPRM